MRTAAAVIIVLATACSSGSEFCLPESGSITAGQAAIYERCEFWCTGGISSIDACQGPCLDFTCEYGPICQSDEEPPYCPEARDGCTELCASLPDLMTTVEVCASRCEFDLVRPLEPTRQ